MRRELPMMRRILRHGDARRSFKDPRYPRTVTNKVVHSDPEIMSGEPVFVGTRVPVYNLFEYLEAGDSLDVFLDAFPSVTKDQAIAALEIGKEAVRALANSHR
jgi:uncharacterized protein (DUF433 family)